MNEFHKFEAKEEESLESVYERLLTLVNVMGRNDVRLIKVSINTKFLNSLQPEWREYVTLTRQNKILSDVKYDALYDALLQFEPRVQASKVKRAAKNHDSLALIAHSNAYLELQMDTQEDKLTTAMMLLARAITQKFSTPTNNRICTSSNTRNQVVIHDGRVDIQTKNAGYDGNGNRNTGRQNKNQAANAGNGLVQQIDESHYARDCPKPKVHDAKYFREQMLLAMKDEAGGTLNDEENDFMLDNTYGDETLEELIIVRLSVSNIIFDDPYVENNSRTVKHASNAHDQSFEFSTEQAYFSTPSTSIVSSESSKEISDLPTSKMPNESKLLKMFDEMNEAILALRKNIDVTLLKDEKRNFIDDGQNTLRQFYKTDVIPMSLSLIKHSKELKQELTEEVQEMLNIFESIEKKVETQSQKDNIFQNKID
ncbi:hypothetical protein Tco_1188531 [Tanacetum coccineum]